MIASLLEPVARTAHSAARPASRRPSWLVVADLVAVLLFAFEGALLGIAAGLT